MKFWLSKNGEISLREQLARQIVLMIASGDLRANDKLPSVREMALRYGVHPNTVSAAYVWLQEKGWIETRQGSGAFVRENPQRAIEKIASSSQNELDALIESFIGRARSRGFSRAQIIERLNVKLATNRFKQILLVEADKELSKILRIEIESAIDLPIEILNSFNCQPKANALVVALEETANKLNFDAPKIVLKFNSAQNEMRGKARPAANEMIGVASAWEAFLRWSKMMLVAAGISAEQIILRDRRASDWQRGLQSCAFVIADSLTAQELPQNCRKRVFQLIARESLQELRALVD